MTSSSGSIPSDSQQSKPRPNHVTSRSFSLLTPQKAAASTSLSVFSTAADSPAKDPATTISPPLPLSSESQLTATASASVTSPSTASNIYAATSSNTTNSSPPPPALPTTTDDIASSHQLLTSLLTTIGTSHTAALAGRAQTLHTNADALASQRADLARNTAALRRGNDDILKEVEGALAGLKGLGNVQNWAECVERDFVTLGETLRLVREGDGSGTGSSGSECGSWSGSGSGSETDEHDGQNHDEDHDTTRRTEHEVEKALQHQAQDDARGGVNGANDLIPEDRM